MRFAASTVLLLVGCQSSGGDDFPVVPGGDDTVITPAADAPYDVASTDGATSLTGRVCVLVDRRNLTSCTTADASGITVGLGTSTAVTATDGSFTIAAPQESNLVWLVTASGFVTTVMPLGTVHLLPFVSSQGYDEALLDNGVILQAGQGSLVTRVLRNGAPAVGVTATVDPPSQYGPLYDGTNPVVWDRDATGTAGVVWFPDVLEGSATLALMPPAAAAPVTLALPIVEGAITFATVGIP